jgi:hypothetical protein
LIEAAVQHEPAVSRPIVGKFQLWRRQQEPVRSDVSDRLQVKVEDARPARTENDALVVWGPDRHDIIRWVGRETVEPTTFDVE